jgi:hypothetical protein
VRHGIGLKNQKKGARIGLKIGKIRKKKRTNSSD